MEWDGDRFWKDTWEIWMWTGKRQIRHIDTTRGTEPLDLRKDVLTGTCSDRASKGANIVIIGSMENGMRSLLFFGEGVFGVKEESRMPREAPLY